MRKNTRKVYRWLIVHHKLISVFRTHLWIRRILPKRAWKIVLPVASSRRRPLLANPFLKKLKQKKRRLDPLILVNRLPVVFLLLISLASLFLFSGSQPMFPLFYCLPPPLHFGMSLTFTVSPLPLLSIFIYFMLIESPSSACQFPFMKVTCFVL